MTTTPEPIADHRDAIIDVAKVHGITVIVDSGGNGNVLVLADQAQAREYLDGASSRDVGTLVEVTFNHRGEVTKTRMRVDGQPRGDVTGTRGNAGQRLLWTLQMLDQADDGE